MKKTTKKLIGVLASATALGAAGIIGANSVSAGSETQVADGTATPKRKARVECDKMPRNPIQTALTANDEDDFLEKLLNKAIEHFKVDKKYYHLELQDTDPQQLPVYKLVKNINIRILIGNKVKTIVVDPTRTFNYLKTQYSELNELADILWDESSVDGEMTPEDLELDGDNPQILIGVRTEEIDQHFDPNNPIQPGGRVIRPSKIKAKAPQAHKQVAEPTKPATPVGSDGDDLTGALVSNFINFGHTDPLRTLQPHVSPRKANQQDESSDKKGLEFGGQTLYVPKGDLQHLIKPVIPRARAHKQIVNPEEASQPPATDETTQQHTYKFNYEGEIFELTVDSDTTVAQIKNMIMEKYNGKKIAVGKGYNENEEAYATRCEEEWRNQVTLLWESKTLKDQIVLSNQSIPSDGVMIVYIKEMNDILLRSINDPNNRKERKAVKPPDYLEQVQRLVDATGKDAKTCARCYMFYDFDYDRALEDLQDSDY